MRITLLGTGTSHGVPVIACDCDVCRSSDERDKRTRCSAYIESGSGENLAHVLIDTGPDFRVQALRFGIKKLDAVLITHSHADHLNGLDDLRIFSHTDSADKHNATEGPGLPIYADEKSVRDIHHRFDYIFQKTQLGGGKPKLDVIDCAVYGEKNPIQIGSLSIFPIPMLHGNLPTTGWLVRERSSSDSSYHSIAYLTDCNQIPQSSFDLIKKVGGVIAHAVIDGLREKPHVTHFSFSEAMQAGAKIGAGHVWLTHITHDMSHANIEKYCRDYVSDDGTFSKASNSVTTFAPAFDGLVLTVGE